MPLPIFSLQTTYRPAEIDDAIDIAFDMAETVQGKKKSTIYNVPCSFDIETTSFYRDGTECINYAEMQRRRDVVPDYSPAKAAIMYCWQMSLNGVVIFGRTWAEFVSVIGTLVMRLGLDSKHRLIIYVHNLAWEFQFIRKLFEWEKVFAIDERKPIYAITTNGIEFRCSYLLSGYSLESLGRNLTKYHIEKKAGDLDYSLLRHSRTPMTEQEIGYCVNDVQVVVAYIAEQIEEYGNIARIPITNTGRVREYCRAGCIGDEAPEAWLYRRRMKAMSMTPEEFKQNQRAFQGGFTHADPLCVPFWWDGEVVEKIYHDVTSIDFTSSYPYVMVSEQFPMSTGRLVEITSDEQLWHYLTHYCCLFDVEFNDLSASFQFDHYISQYKCYVLEGATTDNGRVVCAKRIQITLTEQDYFIIRKTYHIRPGSMKIFSFRIYEKGYLPTDFVRSILWLYEQKTKLKGVAGKEVEYMRAKNMLNSTYG